MNLIDELKMKSNQADNTKQSVIDEIKSYFDEYLDSDKLENFLKANIREDDIKARKKSLWIEFWAYLSGCSTTYFYCCGKYWYNPECKEGWESRQYKGIELRTIQHEICPYLTRKLISRVSELGFDLLWQEDRTGSTECYKREIRFGW